MTVKRHKGRMQDFLGYYDKSVSLLRKSLAGGQIYTDGTFLTTLQLATFEVSANKSRCDVDGSQPKMLTLDRNISGIMSVSFLTSRLLIVCC